MSWLLDASANRFVQSYVNNFMDISGNFKVIHTILGESRADITQLGADIDGEAAGDYSGYSVSLSEDGTRVAIGAYLNDGTGTDAGHVRVYEYSGGSWTQLGADIDGEATIDYSG